MSENTLKIHHRRSIRLKGYDYSLSGAYFITICVEGGACLLGSVAEDLMHENSAGVLVKNCWLALTDRFDGVDIDTTIVMPNHIHGIIFLSGVDEATTDSNPAGDWAATRAAPTLGDIVGAFKSITTNEYIRGIRDIGRPAYQGRFWQRNYWERIIRNERELDAIQKYINSNPANWKKDKLYTGN
jgi:putative transposase